LLDKGADVDWGHGGNYDRTPLYIACEKGHDTIVDEGAVNGDYYIGPEWETKETTLLHTACDNGHYKVVKVLLDKGAEIRGSSNEGEHPLVAACKSGNKDIVRLLLDEGADVNLTSGLTLNDSGCSTLLYTACAHGHADVVKVLLKHEAINVNSGKEYTTVLTVIIPRPPRRCMLPVRCRIIMKLLTIPTRIGKPRRTTSKW